MAFQLQEKNKKATKKVSMTVLLTSSAGGTLIFGAGFLAGRPEAAMDYVKVYPEDETLQIALRFSDQPRNARKITRSSTTCKVPVANSVQKLGFVLRNDNPVIGMAEWVTVDLPDEAGVEALLFSFPPETNGIALIPHPDQPQPPLGAKRARTRRPGVPASSPK